jgi:hypothetical protein
MDAAAWLAELKAGDEVAVEHRNGFARGVWFGAVTGRERGRIIVRVSIGTEMAFSSNGEEVEFGFWLLTCPVALRARMEHAARVAYLREVRWEALPLEVLRAVVGSIEAEGQDANR